MSDQTNNCYSINLEIAMNEELVQGGRTISQIALDLANTRYKMIDAFILESALAAGVEPSELEKTHRLVFVDDDYHFNTASHVVTINRNWELLTHEEYKQRYGGLDNEAGTD